MFNELCGILLRIIFLTIVLGNSSGEDVSDVPDTPTSVKLTKLSNICRDFPDIGVSYKFYNQSVTWDSARKACLKENSNLAVVDSFQKYEYIMDMIKIGNGAGPHVGIYKPSINSEWVSSTNGLPPTEIPWAPLTWVKDQANRCLAMWNNRSGVGADICNRLRPYVCEIPLLRD